MHYSNGRIVLDGLFAWQDCLLIIELFSVILFLVVTLSSACG